MDKTEAVREILIQRYSKLSNVSFEKSKSKFENTSIDLIIEKQKTTITLSIILVAIVSVTLIAQFVSLYLSKSLPLALITNILVLIIFQKGLHDNFEIKEILKTLKEIGLH
jgi:hypothetical protein